MEYPPFVLLQHIDFKAMRPREAREFCECFVQEVPNRVGILCSRVSGMRAEDAFSLASFDLIEAWMAGVVDSRPKSAVELNRDRQQLQGKWSFLDVGSVTLSDSSISIGVDVGIYVAEYLRRNRPELNWSVARGGITNVTYNHPVLGCFSGKTTYSPIHAGYIMAMKCCDALGTQRIDLARFVAYKLEDR